MSKELMNDRLLTDIANEALNNEEFTIDDLSEYITEETRNALEKGPEQPYSKEEIDQINRDFASAMDEMIEIAPDEAISARTEIFASEVYLNEQQKLEEMDVLNEWA